METLKVHIHLGSEYVAHTLEQVVATVSELHLMSRGWEFTNSLLPRSELLVSDCDIFIAIVDEHVLPQTWIECEQAAKLDKIRMVFVAQAAVKSSLENIKPLLNRLGQSVTWMPYHDALSLRQRLGRCLVVELRKRIHVLRLEHELQVLGDYEDNLQAGDKAVVYRSDGGDIAPQGIIDKRTGGIFFDRPGVVIYQGKESQIIPGTTYDHSLLPTTDDEFYRAVKIGSASPETPTVIRGDVVRNQVGLGDCCHVEGSVFALEDVRLGSHVTIGGYLITLGTVFLEGDCNEITSAYAREVMIHGHCHFQGNLVCERLLIEESDILITSKNLKVDGVLATAGNIILGEEYSLKGIFVDGDLTLERGVEAEFVVCTGRLTMAEECKIVCAVANRITVGPGSEVKAIIAKDLVEKIDDCAQVGILYASRGVAQLGHRVVIGNFNLFSREVISEIEFPIRIGAKWYEKSVYLGTLKDNRVIVSGSASNVVGNLLSSAIDAELYSLLSREADLPLTLPAKMASHDTIWNTLNHTRT